MPKLKLNDTVNKIEAISPEVKNFTQKQSLDGQFNLLHHHTKFHPIQLKTCVRKWSEQVLLYADLVTPKDTDSGILWLKPTGPISKAGMKNVVEKLVYHVQHWSFCNTRCIAGWPDRQRPDNTTDYRDLYGTHMDPKSLNKLMYGSMYGCLFLTMVTIESQLCIIFKQFAFAPDGHHPCQMLMIPPQAVLLHTAFVLAITLRCLDHTSIPALFITLLPFDTTSSDLDPGSSLQQGGKKNLYGLISLQGFELIIMKSGTEN